MGGNIYDKQLEVAESSDEGTLEQLAADVQLTKLQRKTELLQEDPDVEELAGYIEGNDKLKGLFTDIVEELQGASDTTNEDLLADLQALKGDFLAAAQAAGLDRKEKKLYAALWKQPKLQQAWANYLATPVINHLVEGRRFRQDLGLLKAVYTEAYQKAAGKTALQTKISNAYRMKYAALTKDAAYESFISSEPITGSEGQDGIEPYYTNVFKKVVDKDLGDILTEDIYLEAFQILLRAFHADAKVLSGRGVLGARNELYDGLIKSFDIPDDKQQRPLRQPLTDTELLEYAGALGITLTLTDLEQPDISDWLQEGGLNAQEIAQLGEQAPTEEEIVEQTGELEVVEVTSLDELFAITKKPYADVQARLYDISAITNGTGVDIENGTIGLVITKNGAMFRMTPTYLPIVGFGEMVRKGSGATFDLWGMMTPPQGKHTMINHPVSDAPTADQKASFVKLLPYVEYEEQLEQKEDNLHREGVPFDERMPEELRNAPIITHDPDAPASTEPLDGGSDTYTLREKSMTMAEALAATTIPKGQVTIISDAKEPTYNYENDKIVGPKKYIILHSTAGSRENDLTKGTKSADYSLYIDKKGNVYQFFDPTLGGGAAGGYAKIGGDVLVNPRGIAVEFEAAAKPASVQAPSGQMRDEAELPNQAQRDAFNKTVLPYLASKGYEDLTIVTSAQVVTGDKVDKDTGLREDFLGGEVHYDTYARPADVLSALGGDPSLKREGPITQQTVTEIEHRLKLMKQAGVQETDKRYRYRQDELQKAKKTLGITVTEEEEPAPPPKQEKEKPAADLGLVPINTTTGDGINQNMNKLTDKSKDYFVQGLTTKPLREAYKKKVIADPLSKGELNHVILISLPITLDTNESEYRGMMGTFFDQGGIFEKLHTQWSTKKVKIIFSNSYAKTNNGDYPYTFTDKDPIRVAIYSGRGVTGVNQKFDDMDNEIIKYVNTIIGK